MIYRKLRKLKEQERDIQSLIIAAYQSSADPDVVMIRVSDLQTDLESVNDEIQMEETFVRLKWGLAFFVVASLILIIVTLFKTLL
jgi:hypothetical protein